MIPWPWLLVAFMVGWLACSYDLGRKLNDLKQRLDRVLGEQP